MAKFSKDSPFKQFQNAPHPSSCYERARQASIEERKLLVSLSIAVIGVFFLALTKTSIEISTLKLVTALIGLASMTLTIFWGILGWHADGKRNYLWAREQEEEREEIKIQFQNLRLNKWQRIFTFAGWGLRITFMIGVVVTIIHVISSINF